MTINDSATATSGTVTIWNGNLIVHGTSGATCILGDGTGGTTCSSDQRLKQNVTDLHSALAEINQLRPVTYNWIDPRYADANNIGFIAQEMQRVYPEFVNVVDPKTGYLGINYAGLVTPIVKAIQEIDIKLEPLTSIDPNQDGSLASLIRSYLANALNGIQDIFAARVQTKELCIDDVCVTKTELQQVLNQANVQSAIIGPVQGIPNNGNGLEAGAASSPAANGDASATSTATSTDAGAPVDSSSTGTSTTEAPATDGGAATSTTDGSSVDVIDAGSASNPPAPDASAPTVPDSTSTATSSQ